MSDNPAEPQKPKRAKFKYTRELVRIAVDDGMTQKQIADLCRVEQSVVSGWQNGRSVAFEHQVTELRRRYGHRLNRTTSRVYLARAPSTIGDSATRWEDTERGKVLLAKSARRNLLTTAIRDLTPQSMDDLGSGPPYAPPRLDPKDAPDGLTKEQLQAELDAQDEWSRERLRELTGSDAVEDSASDPDGWIEYPTIHSVILAERELFEVKANPERVTVVEGPIVFRFAFVTYQLRAHGKSTFLAPVPIARWVVHHLARDRFVLVQQSRRPLLGAARRRWNTERGEIKRNAERAGAPKPQLDALLGADSASTVESADDAARWISVIRGPMTSAALLAFCDAYLADRTTSHGPQDEASIPFLLRKALIEHGYDVPGVERIVATE